MGFEAPPHQWLIKHTLLVGGINLVSGQQKLTRKSLASNAMALAIASGQTVGPFTPSAQGRVGFFYEEGGIKPTQNRWEALARGAGLGHEVFESVDFAFREAIKLDDETWREMILGYVEHARPLAVFLDNLSFMHTGDENSGKDMGRVVDTLQAIRNAGTTPILLAHLNDMKGNDPSRDIDTQVRGNKIITNCYDVHLAFRNYATDGAPIDLKIRYRDDVARRYTVRWDLQQRPGSSLLESAALSFELCVQEDEPGYVEHCRSLLKVGTRYSKHDLRKLWGCSTVRLTQEMIAIFEDEDVLSLDPEGVYVVI